MKKCGVSVPLNPTHQTKSLLGNGKIITVEEKGRKKMIMKIVSCTMQKEEFLKHMAVQIDEFREHVFRVHRQFQAFQTIKQNLPQDDAIMIMDFAENYACKSVEEVQSAYWNESAVTLHPVVVYYKDISGDLLHKSIIVVSDEMGHNSATVLSFIDHIVPEVKLCVPSIMTVHYFTDSPTSQYRNKTVFNVIANHEEIYGYKATKHYFEAGHGKGPCDGLGGTAKRTVDDAINTGKVTIQDAGEFFKWTQSPSCSMNIVKFLYVPSTKCQEKSKVLSIAEVKQLKGNMKLHAVVGMGNNQIRTSTVSCYCNECIAENFCSSNKWTLEELTVSKKKHDENPLDLTVHPPEKLPTEETALADESQPCSDINVGDFVAARYDGKVYIGKVLECDDEDRDVEITFIENVRKLLKWPEHEDRLWIDRNETVCKVTAPVLTGKSQRMFKLNKTHIDTVDSRK